MVFDFLVETNFLHTSKIHLTDWTEVRFHKIPDDRQADVWECIGELNDHFRKHDMAISFIRNPYIDFLNFDSFYYRCVKACSIPNTKTGRPAKYSHYINFCMLEEDPRIVPETDTFGEIYFYPSGRIGKAEVVFWRSFKRFTVEFRSTKNEELYLWRVHTRRETDDKEIVVFENTPKP